MNNLNIKINIKVIDVDSINKEEKRLTLKDISKMNLKVLEENVKIIKLNIDKGETNEYNIYTCEILCNKIIEKLRGHPNKENENKEKEYMELLAQINKINKKEDESEKNEQKIREKESEINDIKNIEESIKKGNNKDENNNMNEVNN